MGNVNDGNQQSTPPFGPIVVTPIVNVQFYGTRATAIAVDIPTGTELVITEGYSVAGDFGAAKYVPANGDGPGNFQSADGQWWTLSEPEVCVEMFGSDGTYAGDTVAIQAAIDYVKANYVIATAGNSNQNTVYLKASAYYTNDSLDFTDDGLKNGISFIGVNPNGTIIYSKLTEMYPVFDASGTRAPHIENLSFISDAADLSICSILSANVVDRDQRNNNLNICNVAVQNRSVKCVAGTVIQACDYPYIDKLNSAATVSGAGFYHASTVPATYHGYAKVTSTDTVIDLETGGTYDNDTAYLSDDVIGFPIFVMNGTASGEQSVITDYTSGGGNFSVTVDPPFSVALDATSNIAISAVRSKYRSLSNEPDNTTAKYTDCMFAGSIGAIVGGFSGDLVFDDTYVVSTFNGASWPYGSNIGGLVIDDYYQGYTNVVRFLAGSRIENQAGSATIHAIHALVYTSVIDVSGQLQVSAASGAMYGCSQWGSYRNVIHNAAADDTTPVFHLIDDLGAASGITNFEGNGWISDAGIGNIISIETCAITNQRYIGIEFAATLAAIVKAGFYNTVTFIGNGSNSVAMFAGVNVNAKITAGLNIDVTRFNTTGGSSQKKFSFTVPANALRIENQFRTFEFSLCGPCFGTMTGGLIKLNQAGTATTSASQGGALTDGNKYSFEAQLMNRGGILFWSGKLWNGLTLVADWTEEVAHTWVSTQSFTIEIYENAAAGNVLDTSTWLTRLT